MTEHRPTPDTPPPGVVRIDPHSILTLSAAAELLAPLGIAPTCLKREARLGRLRVSRRSGIYLVVGADLLRWAAGRGAKASAGAAAGD